MRLLFFSFCITFTLYCAFPAWGQNSINASSPIRIEADRMESSQEKNMIIFSGNVRANQDDLIINAKTMRVLYTGNTIQTNGTTGLPAEGPTSQIDTISAEGNVKIIQGDWVGSGDSMDFNAEERIVVLSGNAKAWQDKNTVSGEKIILYLNEGKSVVERSPKEGERVKAFIYPGSPENKDDTSSERQQN